MEKILTEAELLERNNYLAELDKEIEKMDEKIKMENREFKDEPLNLSTTKKEVESEELAPTMPLPLFENGRMGDLLTPTLPYEDGTSSVELNVEDDWEERASILDGPTPPFMDGKSMDDGPTIPFLDGKSIDDGPTIPFLDGKSMDDGPTVPFLDGKSMDDGPTIPFLDGKSMTNAVPWVASEGSSQSSAFVDEKNNWGIRMQMLEARVCNLESRMFDVINAVNSNVEGKKRDVVSIREFEKMVDEALTKGHASLGCSRGFIFQYLVENFDQRESVYVRRKLNEVLKKKVRDGAYKLNKNLFSFA